MPEPTIRDNRSYGKHLALFIPSLAGGGVARFTLHLAKSFVSRGHKVDLLLCRVAGPYLDQIPVGNDKAMAEAILVVLDKPPDRDRLRARASEFDLDTISEAYLQLLLANPTSRVSSQSRD
jgi:hypothetical protein